ncbi:MAG: glycoside hydrolase family 3 C-terminal domain-containing protein [Bacteroidales bacterium]|nr:glycoside hydrolase family 3 C-terminal domain-containing protein [Bacteroidales bacterium]
MSVEEKVAIIHAQSKFSSAGVPRLGIPELWCTDGPHGIRPEVKWDEWDQAGWTNDSIVAFPALTCLAATWNEDMSLLYGRSIGEEARYREKDVLLGPGVNIYRTPLGGRNFEYMGEDPFLAGQLVVPYIPGVQEQGVATCVKHYCLNNEETHRHTVNVDLSDRALYEIYLPAFKKACQEGGSWSIMASYNLYRGEHVCHNDRLLNQVLKGEWGYDGAVISDWGGCHDTDQAIHNGLDLEYGTGTDGLATGTKNEYDNYHLAHPYLQKIRSGEVGTDELDDKARRVLRLIMRTAMRDGKPAGNKCSEQHYQAARRIGDEGIVLLKNNANTLPLNVKGGKILVVGENAVKMMTVGGGSSSLKVQKEISPLDAIRARAAQDGTEVVWARGYVGDVTGSYNGVTTGQDLSEERSAEELIAEAVALAGESDAVIFVGGLNKAKHQDCEGRDRKSMELPYGQDAVVEALAAVGTPLSVVMVSGNAVAMPWVEKVPAILQAWYIGSEAGECIADVVFGDVNPSGRLPFSFPVALSDSPAHQEGMSFPNNNDCFYGEGIFVGYRWFENKGIDVLFPFGHGLSYTTFEYSDASISAKSIKSVQEAVGADVESEKKARKSSTLTVKVSVKNTGDRAGAEVVQLYIQDVEASVERPVKELKGFKKVFLEPGQSKTVSFEINEDMLRFFDDQRHAWVSEKGEFNAIVAASAADIMATLPFSLK